MYLLTLQGILLDCQDVEGNTALHYAALNENPKLAYQLLMCSANEHIKNSENATPMEIAVASGHPIVLGLFVRLLEDPKFLPLTDELQTVRRPDEVEVQADIRHLTPADQLPRHHPTVLAM